MRSVVPYLLLAAAACAIDPTGTQGVTPETTWQVKTIALRGAREEIARNGGSTARGGVYLDSLVGPTPKEYLYRKAHDPRWIDSVIAEGLIDRAFGIPRERSGLAQLSFAVTVGEPYPAGGDSVAVVYAWCPRTFPAEPFRTGKASSWRDTMLRTDSGWVRVQHAPTVAISSCSP